MTPKIPGTERRLRVSFVPNHPHSVLFGGFEVQCLDALEALRGSLLVEAGKIDIWDRHELGDIVHIWGAGTTHYHFSRAVKAANRKLAVTCLLPYYSTPLSRLRFLVSRINGEARYIRKHLALCDVVIVLNRRQKAVAHRYFGVDLSRCCIVNNIVPDSFLNNGRTSPDKRRVLCVGNLCRRKNQLQLIKALAGTEWNLRLVGRVLEGEEAYGAQIREAARAAGNVTIVGEVARNGQELMREYSEAGVFALLSQSEHQPISVLEALASGLPCVIADKPWSRQDAFDSCWQVPAASPAEIRRTVALAQRQAVNTVGRDWVAFNCRVPAVLAALERAYLQCR